MGRKRGEEMGGGGWEKEMGEIKGEGRQRQNEKGERGRGRGRESRGKFKLMKQTTSSPGSPALLYSYVLLRT